MAKQFTEQELRQQAVRALSESLGPVDALRFLALVSREPLIPSKIVDVSPQIARKKLRAECLADGLRQASIESKR